MVVDWFAGRSSVSREEFERFAVRASPALLRSAFLLTGDLGHAEDLLQATLLRVVRRWESIHGSSDAYAHEVLVNLSRDRRRGLGRRPSELPDFAAPAGFVLDAAERLAERDAMTRAIRRLPRAQREVLVLRFFLDLSVSQTAAVLRCSQGTVKSHTARALARMRELLGEGAGAPLPFQSEVPDGQ